ncbi:MAG: hypothetical protein HYS87_02835 [Candidatus Colwellbacteria bacterium]|nr:hypothetical protein [Candidatus Colwellbacteria bacterium]
MKKLTGFIALFGFATLMVLTAAAQTNGAYNYIDTEGYVKRIQAQSAEDALALSVNDASVHSGVIHNPNPLSVGDRFAFKYMYVASDGTLKSVEAATADDAAVLAVDRDPNSGFWLRDKAN